MKKRILALLLMAVMLFSLLPTAVFAEQEPPEEPEQNEEEASYTLSEQIDEPRSREELLRDSLYAYMFRDASFIGTTCGEHLDGYSKYVYTQIKDLFENVAQGRESSTSLVLDGYTASYSGSSYEDALNKAKEDVSAALYAILFDCPYERYWFDNKWSRNVKYSYRSKDDVYYVTILKLTLSFNVAADYIGGSDYSVDTAKTAATASAVEMAEHIVALNASYGDFDKLLNYKNKLCELTDYNYSAAAGNVTGNSPWQIIYMFDGDPTTKVVCEGYAKSFQFLCELTAFNSEDIYAISVSGLAGGFHMWNVVHMDDGRNYLVDVTYCDGGSDSFLIPAVSGSVSEGYRVSSGQTYAYDETTLSSYSTKELELSPTAYSAPPVFIIGDLNGDDTVNAKDIVLLMRRLAGDAAEINTEAADINNDGRLNAKDLVLLMRRLAGADITLG